RASLARARASSPRLGAHREGLARSKQPYRHGYRAHQGRLGGEYRHARISARIAARVAPGARSGWVEGPRDRSSRAEAQPKRGNVVVSRRVILEKEQKQKRESLASGLAEGAVVTGKVKNITDYGVFVDLGGLDGLLHVSDLVWGRVPHPSTVVQPGEEIQVQILKFDKEKQ